MTADLVTVVMGRVREREELQRKHAEPLRVEMRPPARKTHCKHGHEFTDENTRISLEGWRKCRTCERDLARRRVRPHAKRAKHTSVRCPSCGHLRVLSERQAFRVSVGEATGRCDLCVNAAHVLVTDALCNWWLARYPLSEIREMAAGLEFLSTALQQRPAERSMPEAMLDGHQPKG